MGNSNSVRDVIVVGAGPAGSVLAADLAKKGVDVLLLEKDRMPRYKTCGGGVNLRAARLLDFDISPVTERVVYGGEVTYKLRQGFVKSYPEPLTYMVMRDRFDCLLAQRAADSGVSVMDGQKVMGVERNSGHISVLSQGQELKCRLVVGADGANSVVARHLGLMKGMGLSIALEAEVEVSEITRSRWESLVTIDVGVIPGGYAWVFPKEAHLSIGVVGDVKYAHRLKKYLHEFLDTREFNSYHVRQLKGHRMPMRRRGMDIQSGPGLLLGDAAGLIDPFSGDGIYYAIKSAQLASPVILQALDSRVHDFKDYQVAVDREIMPERVVAATMLTMFNWAPYICFQWLKRNHLPWREACKIIRGEKDYTSIRERLGPMRIFFDMIGGSNATGRRGDGQQVRRTLCQGNPGYPRKARY